MNFELMVLVRERFMLLIRKPQKAFDSVKVRQKTTQDFHHCHNVNALCGLASWLYGIPIPSPLFPIPSSLLKARPSSCDALKMFQSVSPLKKKMASMISTMGRNLLCALKLDIY